MFISKDAEEWVLGELINDPDSINRVDLEARDFYEDKHRVIFNAFCEMRENNEPINLDTIKAKLKGQVDGIAWIGIDEKTITSGRLTFWANEVKKASALRTVETAHKNLTQNIEADGFDPALDKFRETINSLSAISAISEPPQFHPDIFVDSVKELIYFDEHGLKTGFPTIDKALRAVRDFVTISGNPGTGKTAIALQWAIKWAEEKKVILYFDFENSKHELARRIMSNRGNFTYEDLKEGKASIDFQNECLKLCQTYLWIIKPSDLPGNITPSLIQAFIKYFNGNVVVIIDSINKLAERYPLEYTEKRDRRSMIDAWLGKLEEIKDGFNIPVIITSEVPKPEGGKKEVDTTVFAPKETGRIAFTSRIMFVLKRKEGEWTGKLDLIKNQFGEAKKDVPITFHKFVWRIEEKEQYQIEEE